MQSLIDELVAALEAGTFHVRPDKHASWMPGVFDLRGWREAMRLLDTTLAGLDAIQQQSRLRIVRTGEPGIPATVGILGFERAPG